MIMIKDVTTRHGRWLDALPLASDQDAVELAGREGADYRVERKGGHERANSAVLHKPPPPLESVGLREAGAAVVQEYLAGSCDASIDELC